MTVRRVALVASHVIQYQDPFFRLLAGAEGIDLTVLYASRAGAETYLDREMQTALRWNIDLLQGYRHEFLSNLGWDGGYTRRINPGVVPAILFGRFDAVILFLGWGTVTSLLAIVACRMSGTPFFLFGDSSHPPPAITQRGRVRAAFVRAIFRLASGFFVSGKLNADYYRHYDAKESRFFLLPWAVDNDRFARGSNLSESERATLRKSAGIETDDLALVFSAKLLPRKDPLTLVEAVARSRARARTVIIFLGEGELRNEVEQRAAALDVRVHFAGFVNQSELPQKYAMGDVFVLPSVYEPRGAVINEAMACGLPVIVSDRCGSIGDIVRPGENARVFPAGDAQALATILDDLHCNAGMRRQMGERSRGIIAEWSYAAGVRSVVKAVQSLC